MTVMSGLIEFTFTWYMGAAIAPSPQTSTNSFWLRPAAFANVRPSENDANMEPIIMFTTSFILAPFPTYIENIPRSDAYQVIIH